MDLSILINDVIKFTEHAGGFIRTEAAAFECSRIEYKGLNGMASYVNKTAEQMLVSGLATLLPSAGFITEGKTIDPGSSIRLMVLQTLSWYTHIFG